MNDREWLATEFERSRPHLHAVAYRMLGSVSEADDAVQEAWLRLDRSGSDGVEDLRAWLTTVVGRISLDMLRARRSRNTVSSDSWMPEPIVSYTTEPGPEDEVVMADSVGLALLVVLETLSPAERLAFVLHDVFGVGFDEIASIVDKSPAAARQLASRARRRVREANPPNDDLPAQRRVVDAFLAASRAGDFNALLAVLDPEVEFRIDRDDRGHLSRQRQIVVGAPAVAQRILSRGTPLANLARPVIVNGAAGALVGPPERPFAVVAFTVADGKIVAMDLITDREKILAGRRLSPR